MLNQSFWETGKLIIFFKSFVNYCKKSNVKEDSNKIHKIMAEHLGDPLKEKHYCHF